jgi:hypothetical protein
MVGVTFSYHHWLQRYGVPNIYVFAVFHLKYCFIAHNGPVFEKYAMPVKLLFFALIMAVPMVGVTFFYHDWLGK